ncbi:hypothetical protein PG993_015248 [Apiospora rasikravindrae]|uniref:Uncharacterized protein n=1 Tax=Apiospora rasikravindrae TaxID=990691 RepID=A0ABR1RR83_9PEZI
MAAAAAFLSPPQSLGPTTITTNMFGGDGSLSPMSCKSPDDYRRELMMEYARAEYDYVITPDEADEIFFKPHWWEDVDAFVQYMQDVDFGLPNTVRVYTDEELDAMEETGDFYPPTPDLSPSSDGSASSVGSLELENEQESVEAEAYYSSEDEEEDLEEELPTYGESLSASPLPTYMDAVDAIFAALGQELEELGLVDHDYHPQQQPEVESECEDVEDEPKDDQLYDDLSSWLASLAVPTTPHASVEIAAEDDEDDVDEMIDAPPPPMSPVVVETCEAVEVTMELATPAVVEVVSNTPKRATSTSSLHPVAPPAPTPTATPSRRERFGRRVRQIKSKLSRGLKAISSWSSSSSCSPGRTSG